MQTLRLFRETRKDYLLQYLKPNSNNQSSLHAWFHQLSPAWTILNRLWHRSNLAFTTRHHRSLAHKCSSMNISTLLIRTISFCVEEHKRSTSRKTSIVGVVVVVGGFLVNIHSLQSSIDSLTICTNLVVILPRQLPSASYACSCRRLTHVCHKQATLSPVHGPTRPLVTVVRLSGLRRKQRTVQAFILVRAIIIVPLWIPLRLLPSHHSQYTSHIWEEHAAV